MNIYVIIGVVGIISGLLCAQADVPLAWSGRKEDSLDSKAVGRISPWWTQTSLRHFDKAFWLSCIGQPGTYLTTWSLTDNFGNPKGLLGRMMLVSMDKEHLPMAQWALERIKIPGNGKVADLGWTG